MFAGVSHIAVAMCSAGIVAFLIGILPAKNAVAQAHGLDKIVALANICVAIPLAVFGALHLFAPQFVVNIVPHYMPWPMFWAYLVGCGLIAASLSIASNVGVRWSGLLFGTMMFLFVAMIHLPGALHGPHNRILWTIVFREMSFGGAGWILAGNASRGWSAPTKRMLITVGRILIALTAIVFGFEHFLHPLALPGVPNDISRKTIVHKIRLCEPCSAPGKWIMATNRNIMAPNSSPDQRTPTLLAMLNDAAVSPQPTKYAQNRGHGM